MAVKTFMLPDLGEGLTEAELVAWLVKVGDPVAVDQPIAEVETAKSMVEVPSPYAGVVHQLHGAAGETIDVGKPLISVAEGPGSEGTGNEGTGNEGSGGGGSAEGTGAAAAAGGPLDGSSGGQTYAEEELAGARPEAAAVESEGSGNVLIGYGTSGGHAGGRTRRPRSPRGASGPGRAGPAGSGAASGLSAAPGPGERGSLADSAAPAQGTGGAITLERGVAAPLVVSPIVRKLARDHAVDVAALRGSGPDGLVLRADVEAAIFAAAPAESHPEAGGAAEEATGSPASDALTGLPLAARTPVKGVRKAIAQAMTRSRAEIPEATVWVDVDATALLELRAGLKAADPANTPGLLALIARFTLAGLARYPELNTRIETAADGSQEIVSFDGVNLGFAAQTDRGLVVPCVRGAHRLSARGLDAEIGRLTALARDGAAAPKDLSGSTFTLNNYGVFGVDGSAAIINYPEAAILGVGRIIERPWVVNGQLAVRKVTELTLTFDHRVCDGGTAAGFLRYVADAIQNPATVLADL
ncbi:dihydrolipoamide acetyltransferase component of pyruvate dehydrogenase complex [Zafaria cholistanensis]|uniref:Dihydrolipoamide acetyltransferase component of pyruvate dehydrogenase complex n=1 Tax=Zafaria cholistanensis TaxID=1682741 RepID=A0A5A7NUZ8_9MICC|nr:dihydrolipoamide acetyltransferase family protein [Zafaria cholistanensis]GER23827.1 dihydrolipoamide acetyltransferase component of pyruvate dehydrogenase complex [Zafaria cholistanensis]